MKIVQLSRKWLLVIPILLGMIMLASCSSYSPSTPAPATSGTPTPTATSTPSRTPSPSPSTVAAPSIEITSPTGGKMGSSPAPTATGTPAPAPSPTATPSSSGQAVTIDLIAQRMAFDKSTISVPAGASVTVNFNNKDGGIPHNFAVYQNLSGGQVKAIFVGDTIAGPATITYHFTAPSSPGNYFFDCDIHPQIMNGTFVVTP